MHDMPDAPSSPAPPWPPAPAGTPARRRRPALKLVVGLGAVAGVAVGATALAQAATSGGTAPSSDATVTASAPTSTTTTEPEPPHGFAGPGRFGGLGGFAGPGSGAGAPIYGQFTVKGPNGYETVSVRTGTVSDVTNTSGSNWSLTVKSADGTSGTFTVDSGTSVNGGQMGIASVKSGDTVHVMAVVSGSTSTAKRVTDETVLKANAGSWEPTPPTPPAPTGNTGSTAPQASTPPM
jgi:hypothetical protein